jgi:hypothetical protein
VDVISRVARAVVGGRAARRVRAADGNRVIVDMIAVRVMHVAAVQEVFVAFVLDLLVAAVRAVLMRMVLVGLVLIGHLYRS